MTFEIPYILTIVLIITIVISLLFLRHENHRKKGYLGLLMAMIMALTLVVMFNFYSLKEEEIVFNSCGTITKLDYYSTDSDAFVVVTLEAKNLIVCGDPQLTIGSQLMVFKSASQHIIRDENSVHFDLNQLECLNNSK